jgi:hypothetical protein
MKRRLCIGLVPLVALLTSQAAAAPRVPLETPAPVTAITQRELERMPIDRNYKDILRLHNQVRSEVNARPLRWNLVLADHARTYAQTLANTGQLLHSSRANRRFERENLALSPRGTSRPLTLVRLWAGERRYFYPGVYPNVCQGGWSRCAHYTQMIWPTTTDVGCGFASGLRYDALVCRYSPPGNRDGYPVILPPGALEQIPVVRPRLPPPRRP